LANNPTASSRPSLNLDSQASIGNQVKIPAAVANYLVLTKVDADLALSAEQSTAQGQ